MKLKLSLLSLCAILASGLTASAQDYIFKTNGGKEEVKVKEVGTRTIVYKKWNNQDGPDFVIPKGDVERIEFENGDEEFFSKRNDRRPMRGHSRGRGSNEHYGKNILALSPISMNNTSATGVGISYERVLDKNYIVSLVLPVTFSFRSEDDYYNNNAVGDRDARVLWFSPGVKFYPSGSNHKVTYAVGVNVPIVTGDEPQYVTHYDPQTGTSQNLYTTDNIFMTGLMVTNYLNIQPTPKLYLGLQFGLGIPYYMDESNSNNYYYGGGRYYDTMTPLVDLSFKIGFRF